MVLFIYGAGGAGGEVYDMVIRNSKFDGRYSEVYFVVDGAEEQVYNNTKVMDFSSCEKYAGNVGAEFIVAVGEPASRRVMYDKLKREGYSVATLIDQTAIISPTSVVSEGCIVNAHAIVSSNTVIKENCMVMFDAIVGHHALVERDCVICPKATIGGRSMVGAQAFLGLGSSMLQGVNIGKGAIVGLGSMVFKDVDEGATVVGNPARATKGNSEHRVFG